MKYLVVQDNPQAMFDVVAGHPTDKEEALRIANERAKRHGTPHHVYERVDNGE